MSIFNYLVFTSCTTLYVIDVATLVLYEQRCKLMNLIRLVVFVWRKAIDIMVSIVDVRFLGRYLNINISSFV
ncbi:MAG: hypothetical protein GFH27_549349n78 [Chloroflexi bacterium AL-W]|nr:hypothetical protein [Chloroflexi bacterium AL-N1]NOK69976.1 hypothetical protein [Chloroflexi bacterium AL-N10]NOK73726.1 hypothetical protein [Chloroflexi bacterium AL-N5]NOK85508.1 hypothetical protein [Chloroflexi bacterium AL-W]NOK91709.1 hypothetical protein [Chloroflexi bacterium AL-N15]